MSSDVRTKFLEHVITCTNKAIYGKKFLKNSPIQESDLQQFPNDDMVVCNFYYLKDFTNVDFDEDDNPTSGIIFSWFSKSLEYGMETSIPYNRLCRFYLEKNIEDIFLCSEVLIKNRGDLSIIVDCMPAYEESRKTDDGYTDMEDNQFKLSLIYNCAVHYPEALPTLLPLVSKKYFKRNNVEDYFNEKYYAFPSPEDLRKAVKTFINVAGKQCFQNRFSVCQNDKEWEKIISEELSV